MRHSLEQILHLAKGKLAKQTGYVYFAQIVQAVLGFTINILLIRRLAVDDYGSLSIFNSTFMLLSGVSHWGWTETFVRFGALHSNAKNFGQVEHFFRKKILLLSFFSFVALALASPLLATRVYNRPDWTPLLIAAGITGVLTCLYSFEMNRVRILQQFKFYVSGIIAASSLRLLGILLLIFFGALHLKGTISVYLLSTLLMIALVWIFVPAYFGKTNNLPADLVKSSSEYNRWLLLSIFCTTLITNMDFHFLAHFHGASIVAKLGASSRLTLPISILVGALTTTLLPKLSQSHENKELFQFYIRKLRLILPLLTVCFALGGAAAIPLLSLLAGEKYSGLESILLLQLVAILIVLLTNPFGLILLAKGKAKALACMNLGQLACSIVLNFLLVPSLGVVGSICATIGVNLIGFMVTLLLVSRLEI